MVPAVHVPLGDPLLRKTGVGGVSQVPIGGGTAGLIFTHSDNYWGVQITDGSTDNVILQESTSGGAGSTKATASPTINAGTEYLLRVRRIQRHVEFEVYNAAGTTLLGGGEYDSDDGSRKGVRNLFRD